MNNLEIKTYDELLKEFEKSLLIRDRNILKVLIGTVVANQLEGKPNWIFIVANSSGGKTEFLQSLYDITLDGNKLITPISDMTVNTFASGQKKIGKETSLLHKMPMGGIMVFKDFTSMISKNKEARSEIFGQFREIYDRSYLKHTGTGDSINWNGKIGAIAGATEMIYQHQEEFSAMGDRFLMYSMIQPDREEFKDFLTSDERINADTDKEEAHLKNCVKDYTERIFEIMQKEKIELESEVKKDLFTVADFCTRVRSGVITDERRKGIVEFVPSIEMPMRMFSQLIQLAKAFSIMRKVEPAGKLSASKSNGYITKEETETLYKIAFDSIPIKRRLALKLLTQYKGGATTKALAVKLNYQTQVVNGWMAQLNGLGICKRDEKSHGNKGDHWTMLSQYQNIMSKFAHIEVTNESLETEDEIDKEDINEAWEANVFEEFSRINNLEF